MDKLTFLHTLEGPDTNFPQSSGRRRTHSPGVGDDAFGSHSDNVRCVASYEIPGTPTRFLTRNSFGVDSKNKAIRLRKYQTSLSFRTFDNDSS